MLGLTDIVGLTEFNSFFFLIINFEDVEPYDKYYVC